jgi:exonuclease SbcC
MIITALRLRNIKSFVDAELQFTRGINVIAGANGAGKSTVIEAVGLALFDAWPQKFKEGNARAGFLRHGEKEGSIEVDVLRGDGSFTLRCELGSRTRSGRVSIDYERVLLDGEGREVASSAGRKKEFQEDVREHILGEARIDDDKLFSDIIGTEQGAFDDPFTRPEAERKTLFEKILGIEDFQYFDRQFGALVKMQHGEAEKLRIRVEEHAGLPDELAKARSLHAEREAELSAAAQTLKTVSVEVDKARKAVDKLSANRDALQKAEGEHTRLVEKLSGAEAAEEKTTALVKTAAEASSALLRALPGHEAYLAAEKEVQRLRTAAKERDAAKEKLADLRQRYETRKARLQAQIESVEKQRVDLSVETEKAAADLAERESRITTLRSEYLQLKEEKQRCDERAKFAREVTAYVQDLHTVQQTLDNADENMRTLRETFAGIQQRLDALEVTMEFFPSLADESDSFFARHISVNDAGASETPFAPLLVRAKTSEEDLRSAASKAADAVSRKKQEGKGEKEARDLAEKQSAKLSERLAALEAEGKSAAEELVKVEKVWQQEALRLDALLAKHADLDAHIAKTETAVEQHREAHGAYLSAKGAAEALPAHEKSLEEAKSSVRETRAALKSAAKEVEKLRGRVSEEDFVAAKTARDDAQQREKEAGAAHSKWEALVKEQKSVITALQKEVKEYERLRRQSLRTRTEAEFARDVHNGVVRELARHVGASIVRALSAFAADLYQRIAPEQGLTLVWDPDSYAVELRGEQGAVRGRELSGGQLMGVSLAVKLALIKWYAQCRVGFLDEPTTHLDRETRRHLADVIQHLEQLTGDSDPWFDQLFVISHEESFAGAGHLVELTRDPISGSIAV